jgi:hypothetical protein
MIEADSQARKACNRTMISVLNCIVREREWLTFVFEFHVIAKDTIEGVGIDDNLVAEGRKLDGGGTTNTVGRDEGREGKEGDKSGFGEEHCEGVEVGLRSGGVR